MSVVVSSFNMGGIHKTITNTQHTMKNTGKRFILEEEEYEFCPELWDIIKSYALYSNESFQKLMFFRYYHTSMRIYELCSDLSFTCLYDDDVEGSENKRLAMAVERHWKKEFNNRYEPSGLKPLLAPKNKNAAIRIIKKARKYSNKEAKIDISNNPITTDGGKTYTCSFTIKTILHSHTYRYKKAYYEEILKIEQKHSS